MVRPPFSVPLKPRHLIVLLLLNVCWSATPSAFSYLKDVLSPGGVVTLRFGLAGLMLLVFWPMFPGKAPRGRDLVLTSVMGLLVFCLGHRLQVYGAQQGSAGNSALLMAMEPLVTAVGAALFLREKIHPRSGVGFGLGFVGVLLLNNAFSPGFKFTGLFPSLIFMSSFLCETAFSIIGKGLIERSHFTKVTTLALLAGTAGNLLIDGAETVRSAARLDATGWGLVFFMASICTAVGYVYWFVVIRETDVNIAGLTIFMQPVAGFAIALVWIGDKAGANHLWGSLAIVAGLVIALWHVRGNGGMTKPDEQRPKE